MRASGLTSAALDFCSQAWPGYAAAYLRVQESELHLDVVCSERQPGREPAESLAPSSCSTGYAQLCSIA